MSAVLSALPCETDHRRAPRRGAPVRPRLVLVPTGPSAAGAPQRVRPTLRLTRFGRLVVSLLVAAALVALVAVVSGSLASAATDARTITVEAGETLSQIAARELPGLPVVDGVVQLRVLNELPTSQVHAGQSLRIPLP